MLQFSRNCVVKRPRNQGVMRLAGVGRLTRPFRIRRFDVPTMPNPDDQPAQLWTTHMTTMRPTFNDNLPLGIIVTSLVLGILMAATTLSPIALGSLLFG